MTRLTLLFTYPLPVRRPINGQISPCSTTQRICRLRPRSELKCLQSVPGRLALHLKGLR
jgi:hypothetical protein